MEITVGLTDATSRDDGFAALHAAEHRDAWRLAYALCGDAHRAEDAVAEAFAKIYRGWRRGRVRDPRAYLRRAVVNEVNSRFRRLSLERREAQRRHGDDRGQRADDDRLADSDAVLRALRRLPTRQRTALVLRYWGGLSDAEVAAAMGVAVGTVKSSIARGLARLRPQLATEVS